MSANSSGINRISFISSTAPEARKSHKDLARLYGEAAPADADVIVALGGDGLMLRVMHEFLGKNIPIYGMNRGSIGFLMNNYNSKSLIDRLEQAEITPVHPLRMRAHAKGNVCNQAHAINEVSLLRQTHQAAKLRVLVDDQVRLEELICDGILLATPAGSSAYNLSAHGPILPIDAKLLALTPISAFRPRRWRGAILPVRSKVTIDILEPDKRPVNAVADHTEYRSVTSVEIEEDTSVDCKIMFDPEHNWEERILSEQFKY
ncbi:MAG: NAD kinase [Cohaesibacteraceae bacterium]|nr:NAD kinase [Cohaesibacteraceae bacterium]